MMLQEMLSSTNPGLFCITLLEISVFVMGTAYEAPNGNVGNPFQTPNQAIAQEPILLEMPKHFAPNSYNENENYKRDVREVFDAGSMIDSNILNPSLQDTSHKDNYKRNAREAFNSDYMSGSNIMNPHATLWNSDELKIPETLNEDGGLENVGNRNFREILNVGLDSKLSDQDEFLPALNKIETPINLAPELLDGDEDFNKNSHRNLREIDETRPISIQISKKVPENLSLKENSQRNLREIDDTKPISIQISKNVPENLSSKENSHRNLREIDDTKPISIQISKNVPEILSLKENSYRNLREVDDSKPISIQTSKNVPSNLNFIENSPRNVRETEDISVQISKEVPENLNLQENNIRNVREIDDTGPMTGSDVINEDAPFQDSNEMKILTNVAPSSLIEEDRSLKENGQRNAREIDESSLKNTLEQEERLPDVGMPTNVVGDSLSGDGISKEDVNRNVREISGASMIDSNVSDQDVMDSDKIDADNYYDRSVGVPSDHRNLREISDVDNILGSAQGTLKPVSNSGNLVEIPKNSAPALVEENGSLKENIERNAGEIPTNLSPALVDENGSLRENNNRNAREVGDESCENSNILNKKFIDGEVEDSGSNSRNVREIFTEKLNFLDVPKQEIIGDQRNVREIPDESRIFESNVSNHETINGEPRVDRDIADAIPTVETKVSGFKTIDNDVEESTRITRSCKKNHSHHKTNASDDKFVYEKPQPVRASLQMMNLRIVKSKDDLDFLDDVKDNSSNEGEVSCNKKKVKNKICHTKHLHVLQPLKKTTGKIVESPRKKHNLKNSTGLHSGETVLKVLKATLDKSGDGGGNEEDEETEIEEENDNEAIDNNDGIRQKKQKLSGEKNSNNLKSMKDRSRLVGRIVSSPLVAENVPKRVFGGPKKFVLGESRSQNFDSKNRKALFKKEHLKNDDPTFLAGLKVEKNSEKLEEGGEVRNDDDSDDFDENSAKVDDIDATCQSVVGIPNNFEKLTLKDLQNVSEVTEVRNSDQNNFENNKNVEKKFEDEQRQEVVGEEKEFKEEEGEEEVKKEEDEEEECEEEEEEGGLDKRERDDEVGEDESNDDLELENKFEENMDEEEKDFDENDSS